MKNYQFILVIILSFALTISCKQEEKPQPITEISDETPTIVDEIEVDYTPLSWEKPVIDAQVNQKAKPERKAWTEACLKNVDQHFDVLMAAKDIDSIIPKRNQLTKQQSAFVFCELISVVSKYESSWRPALQAKDVNGRTEPKYMATGLLQMNAADDQRNYRTGTTYSFQDLQKPEINIEVGIKIMVTLIKLRGKITYASGEKSPVLRYFFATLITDKKLGQKVLSEHRANANKMLQTWGI